MWYSILFLLILIFCIDIQGFFFSFLRFLIGEAEEEDEEKAFRPVMRTSSLKQDRSSPRLATGQKSRWSEGAAANMRLTSSSHRRSLDDLRKIGNDEFETLPRIEGRMLYPSCSSALHTKLGRMIFKTRSLHMHVLCRLTSYASTSICVVFNILSSKEIEDWRKQLPLPMTNMYRFIVHNQK